MSLKFVRIQGRLGLKKSEIDVCSIRLRLHVARFEGPLGGLHPGARLVSLRERFAGCLSRLETACLFGLRGRARV